MPSSPQLDRQESDRSPAQAPVQSLVRDTAGFLFSFQAMASPCEVRLDSDDADLAAEVGRVAEAEVRRIETKFSRYRPDSVIGRINASSGAEVEVDAETAHLLDFASQCFAVSGGRFDITSGVLRQIWKFDGSDRLPAEADIRSVRKLIGWRKASWRPPRLRLPPGMEIDFGGFGKEYATDRAMDLIAPLTRDPVLVNLGGDLRVSGPHRDGSRWRVAIESVEQAGTAAGYLEIADGALATSGDARRFLLKDGVRYSHILNPRTGRPVVDPPRSVTVAAPTCIEAGLISTLAMLHGARAESFLEREGVPAWCIR
jgi:thiamine biosynthesis lipoprotein